MFPIVPTEKISSGDGSLVFAIRWAANNTSFPPAMASSRLLMDFSRPTNKGTTICGNTIMSRNGNNGSTRFASVFDSGVMVPVLRLLSMGWERAEY